METKTFMLKEDFTMYKNIYMMILESDNGVDVISSMAAKYDLVCTYKIGVYGQFRQHELQIVGPYRRYRKFINELKTWKSNKKDT